MKNKINLSISNLRHTWFIDLDGTIFLHNKYKELKKDVLCNSNVVKFFEKIPDQDFITFTTSRNKNFSKLCEESVKKMLCLKQEYMIIYDLPNGERLLINDKKPSGLNTAIAISTERDIFPLINIKIDHSK